MAKRLNDLNRTTLLLLGSASLALSACGGDTEDPAPAETEETADIEDTGPLPFQDTSLSAEDRAADLVSRLTLEEKAAQMYDKAVAIPRLGIPEYAWWNEALHGVARAGEATVFPQAIGLAATWDEDLMLEVATVISDEGRAKHHDFLSDDVRGMYTGLTFWSPNINIFRDPRWGRGQETYGEDPFLTGRMAVNFVNGLQGDDENYLKTVATVKHYAVHSGPEPSRHRDDYRPTTSDLWETYLPAFKMAFDETDVASVMCAYNAVNGQPACGSELLMVDLLRGELGFDGYVVSDCGAVGDFYYDYAHDYVDTRAEAAAEAVIHGTDLNCGDGEGNKMDALPDAVAQGLITEDVIDTSVERLFTARFKLGMFDDPATVPYTDIPVDTVASDEHLALAEDAARASLVLLKNDGLLPLDEGTKVAVIGPNADNFNTLIANYNGTPTRPTTALKGIIDKVGADNVTHAVGAPIAGDIRRDYALIPAGVLFHEADGEMQPGLMGNYYAEPDMTGEPAVTQVDETVDFNWDASPITGERKDTFGVKWTGYIVPETDGVYRIKPPSTHPHFGEATIDGVSVEGEEFEMAAGERYEIEVSVRIEDFWHRQAVEPEAYLTWTEVSGDLTEEALAAAEGADVIIYVGGIDAFLEGEEMPVELDGFNGGDRTSLDLPDVQQELMAELEATGKPMVVVNFSGSAMALNWSEENAEAIIQAFYPGEMAGNAIADLLWGDYSPSGRLPVTFYTSLDGMLGFSDYSMENRTYKYFDGEPLYPFGYGLSYTSFEYSDLVVPASHNGTGPMEASVTVTNSGDMAGREVMQLYLQRADRANPSVPNVELVAFDVVDLAPGESETVNFTLSPERLGYYAENGALVMPTSGSATLSAGGGQPGFAENAISETVTFSGE